MKRILRFTASWCQPCKALAKQLEEIDTNMPIEVIDIDSNQGLAMEYGIRSVPTLVMMNENVEVKRRTGIVATNLLQEWLKND